MLQILNLRTFLTVDGKIRGKRKNWAVQQASIPAGADTLASIFSSSLCLSANATGHDLCCLRSRKPACMWESQDAVRQPAMSRSYNDGFRRSSRFHDDKQHKSTRLERRIDRTRARQFFVLVLCMCAVCHDEADHSSLSAMFSVLN